MSDGDSLPFNPDVTPFKLPDGWVQHYEAPQKLCNVQNTVEPPEASSTHPADLNAGAADQRASPPAVGSQLSANILAAQSPDHYRPSAYLSPTSPNDLQGMPVAQSPQSTPVISATSAFGPSGRMLPQPRNEISLLPSFPSFPRSSSATSGFKLPPLRQIIGDSIYAATSPALDANRNNFGNGLSSPLCGDRPHGHRLASTSLSIPFPHPCHTSRLQHAAFLPILQNTSAVNPSLSMPPPTPHFIPKAEPPDDSTKPSSLSNIQRSIPLPSPSSSSLFNLDSISPTVLLCPKPAEQNLLTMPPPITAVSPIPSTSVSNSTSPLPNYPPNQPSHELEDAHTDGNTLNHADPASMLTLLRVAFSSDMDGITELNLQDVANGKPDANYQAVINALRQKQNQQQVARQVSGIVGIQHQHPTQGTLDYSALITSVENLQMKARLVRHLETMETTKKHQQTQQQQSLMQMQHLRQQLQVLAQRQAPVQQKQRILMLYRQQVQAVLRRRAHQHQQQTIAQQSTLDLQSMERQSSVQLQPMQTAHVSTPAHQQIPVFQTCQLQPATPVTPGSSQQHWHGQQQPTSQLFDSLIRTGQSASQHEHANADNLMPLVHQEVIYDPMPGSSHQGSSTSSITPEVSAHSTGVVESLPWDVLARAFSGLDRDNNQDHTQGLGDQSSTDGTRNADFGRLFGTQRYHPELRTVWSDLERDVPVVQPQNALQPANLKLRLLPFQLESLFWMKKQEQGFWRGGILADEMGMGKTIQIISLIVSDSLKPNLVVAPTVAIIQWRNEIETHTDGMKVLVWHGHSRETDVQEVEKYDVVLTTYAVLESCFRKQEKGFKRRGLVHREPSPLHQIRWKRVVLDEAHNIKERSTNTAKAAFELQAEYRWCLSGTPIQNRVGELYSLVRFLGGDPFSYYFCKLCECKSLYWIFEGNKSCRECGHPPMQHMCFWNSEVLTPIQKYGMVGPGRDAFKKLKLLLDRVMLRRTKLERADDLGLPPRTVNVRRYHFSPEEKEIYLSLFTDAKRQFSTYVDQGTVLNNYSNIFSLLTRMRQMACHPDLVLRSKSNTNKFIPEEAGEVTVCRLCNDIAEDAIQGKCKHIFDRECIKQYLEAALEDQPACPVCHLPLIIDLEAPALELEENGLSVRQGILGRLNLDNWRSSSKIEALVEELSNLRSQESTTKSIVFSQFVNFLDLIAYRLEKLGFNICRLEGTMSPQARDATIKHFMNNVGVVVFLVSLKAGGVALNLTEASRVYLMDSWWNPAVEYQAMDRIHRLGQRRPVRAIKLVIEDSIESRIIQLQEKKRAMVDATLSTDESAMGRLTPQDLGFLFRL